MSESRTKKLTRFFQAGMRGNPPIKVSAEEYKALCELIENPPKPSPALLLAMDRARRKRESAPK
jgi:hypothetical protein